MARYYENCRDSGLVDEVLAVLQETGAWAYAQNVADGYCAEARRIIGWLALETDVRREFEELIDFLEDRSY